MRHDDWKPEVPEFCVETYIETIGPEEVQWLRTMYVSRGTGTSVTEPVGHVDMTERRTLSQGEVVHVIYPLAPHRKQGRQNQWRKKSSDWRGNLSQVRRVHICLGRKVDGTLVSRHRPTDLVLTHDGDEECGLGWGVTK